MEFTEQKTAGEAPRPKFSVTVTTLKHVNDSSIDDLSTVTGGSKRKFQDIDAFIEEEMFRLEKKKKDMLKSLPVFTGQINASSPDTPIITLLNVQSTDLYIPSRIIKSEEIIVEHSTDVTRDSPLNHLKSNSSLKSEIDRKVDDSVASPPLKSRFNDTIVPEIDSTKSKSLQADNNILNQSTVCLAKYSEEIASGSSCLLRNGSQTEDVCHTLHTDVNETIVSKSKNSDVFITESKDEIKDEIALEDLETLSLSNSLCNEPLETEELDDNKEMSCPESVVPVSSNKRPFVKKLSQNVKLKSRLVKQKSPVKKSAAANQRKYVRKFRPNRWKHENEKLPVTVEPLPTPVEQPPPTIVTIRPPIRVMVKSLDPLEYVVCTEDGLPPQFTPVLSQLDSKSKKCDSTQSETNSTQNETNSTQNETNSTQNETNSTQNETNSTQNETNSNSTPNESEYIIPPYLLEAPKNPWDTIPLPNLNENDNISKEEKLIKYFSENKLSARSIVEDHIQWLRDSNRLWYICPHCQQKLFTRLTFNSHVTSAHQCEPLECEACDENFKTLLLLNRHVKKKHTGNFVCKLCHQNFPTYQSLMRHCVRHPNITNFDCYFCDEFKCPKSEAYKARIIRFRTHLKMHIKNYSDANKTESRFDIPALECEICEVKFESEAHYNLHTKVAHKNMTDEEKEEIKERRTEKLPPEKQMKIAQKQWKMNFKKKQREDLAKRKEAKRKRVEEREKIAEEQRKKIEKQKARLKKQHKYRNMTYADIKKRLMKMIKDEEENEGLQIDANQQNMENIKNDRKEKEMNIVKAYNKDKKQENNSKMKGKKIEDQAKKRNKQKNQKSKDKKQAEKGVEIRVEKDDEAKQAEKKDDEKQAGEVENENVTDNVEVENLAEQIEDENLEEQLEDENLAEQLEDENLADKMEDENIADKVEDENIADKVEYENLTDKVEDENLTEKLNEKKQAEQQITD